MQIANGALIQDRRFNFPYGVDEMFRPVDLAEIRLYRANENGCNRIVPEASHWENTPILIRLP